MSFLIVFMTLWCVGSYLELPIEVAHRGDPGSDDCQEGGSNDGQGALDGAQAQQQSLRDPAGSCTHTYTLVKPSSQIHRTHVALCPNAYMLSVSYTQHRYIKHMLPIAQTCIYYLSPAFHHRYIEHMLPSAQTHTYTMCLLQFITDI